MWSCSDQLGVAFTVRRASTNRAEKVFQWSYTAHTERTGIFQLCGREQRWNHVFSGNRVWSCSFTHFRESMDSPENVNMYGTTPVANLVYKCQVAWNISRIKLQKRGMVTWKYKRWAHGDNHPGALTQADEYLHNSSIFFRRAIYRKLLVTMRTYCISEVSWSPDTCKKKDGKWGTDGDIKKN